MKHMKAIKFEEKDREKISSQLSSQEPQQGVPRSTDPINYPVFPIPVGKKVLVYVPNHVVPDEEGKLCLRMDNPLIHSVTIGKRYMSVRCINGIVAESYGLNGTCPLCDVVSEPWDLANKVIEKKCKAQGLDPTDTENKSVKAIRSEEYSDRKLKDAVRHYTFPMVVFETQNDDGKTILKDENGNLKYRIYWYDCSDKIWNDKWLKALEAMEEEPTHPGGNFFLLNYIYTTKNNKPQIARDAAREFTVNVRNPKNSEKLRELLDKQTEGWTPEKAQETVIANQFYCEDDLKELADKCLEDTRNLIALYEASEVSGGQDANFKLEKAEDADKEEDALPIGSMPIETDEDVTVE